MFAPEHRVFFSCFCELVITFFLWGRCANHVHVAVYRRLGISLLFLTDLAFLNIAKDFAYFHDLLCVAKTTHIAFLKLPSIFVTFFLYKKNLIFIILALLRRNEWRGPSP